MLNEQGRLFSALFILKSRLPLGNILHIIYISFLIFITKILSVVLHDSHQSVYKYVNIALGESH